MAKNCIALIAVCLFILSLLCVSTGMLVQASMKYYRANDRAEVLEKDLERITEEKESEAKGHEKVIEHYKVAIKDAEERANGWLTALRKEQETRGVNRRIGDQRIGDQGPNNQ